MSIEQAIQTYYGETLSSTADLKTSACCDADALPSWLKPLLARVHPEVSQRYYGCGLVCPPLLEGCSVLDLGCGSGRDVYLLAQLVGATGRVVGVDMTPQQLTLARSHQGFHAERFGFANVDFLEGRIETLDQLPLPVESFDVIVSNCVLNLSTNKGAVLQGVRRLLKPGGEFYFADVVVDRRLPAAARQHPVLVGECLGGALYWRDLLRLARAAGFADPRVVTDRPLQIHDPELTPLLEGARFRSATLRLFAIPELEEACEDYGQAVIYLGTIPDHPLHLDLDSHHRFERGRVFPVCGNTYQMLAQTRFRDHFQFFGRFDHHFGPFPGCGTVIDFRAGSDPEPPAASQEPASCC